MLINMFAITSLILESLSPHLEFWVNYWRRKHRSKLFTVRWIWQDPGVVQSFVQPLWLNHYFSLFQSSLPGLLLGLDVLMELHPWALVLDFTSRNWSKPRVGYGSRVSFWPFLRFSPEVLEDDRGTSFTERGFWLFGKVSTNSIVFALA